MAMSRPGYVLVEKGGSSLPVCTSVGMVLCKMHIFASMTESDVLNSAWCLPRSVSWRTSACAVSYDMLS